MGSTRPRLAAGLISLLVTSSEAFPLGLIGKHCHEYTAPPRYAENLHSLSRRAPSRRKRLCTQILGSDNDSDQDAAIDRGTKPAKTRKRAPAPTPWIACSSTKELTRAVRMYARPNDRVAELGSALRDTSMAICDTIGPDGQALLVDVRRNFPKREDRKRTTAMRRDGDETGFFPDRATFVEIEGFESWRRALFFQDYVGAAGSTESVFPSNFDVLVVDVSSIVGHDLELTSISLVKEFLELNDNKDGKYGSRCRVVIVKSASLQSWARRLVHAQRLFSGSVSPSVQAILQPQEEIDLNSNSGGKRGGRTSFSPPVVVGTVGVNEYRSTIPFVVKPGDNVLEIGCHLGTSTLELHKAACVNEAGLIGKGGGCLGIDVGPRIVEGARKRHPNVPFAVADAWRTGDLLRLKHEHLPSVNAVADLRNHGLDTEAESGYDVVYVDVGGLSGSDGLLEAVSLITALGNALEPRCIVIKSLCIRRFASGLVSFADKWQSEKRRESSAQ